MDISEQVGFAIIDVKTRKLNDEIRKMRRQDKTIHIIVEGYLNHEDHSRWDGVSIEQSLTVDRCVLNGEKSLTSLEDEVYQLVTVQPFRMDELLPMVNRVIERMKAIPTKIAYPVCREEEVEIMIPEIPIADDKS